MYETALARPVVDPYERVLEEVGKVCMYDPETRSMICDRTPDDRDAIQKVRSWFLDHGRRTATQFDNAMLAATVSLAREYQQFEHVTPEDFSA